MIQVPLQIFSISWVLLGWIVGCTFDTTIPFKHHRLPAYKQWSKKLNAILVSAKVNKKYMGVENYIYWNHQCTGWVFKKGWYVSWFKVLIAVMFTNCMIFFITCTVIGRREPKCCTSTNPTLVTLYKLLYCIIIWSSLIHPQSYTRLF
jgi:hypothetical protein